VDLATHAIRWRFGAGKTIYSSPLAANGLVYFGADDHTVYAVDAGTGRRRWSYTPAASS
jgi:outer membrane protein assembly factor BamB